MSNHEGWSNYETWSVNLWMANAEHLYRYWRRTAMTAWQEAWDAACEDEPEPSNDAAARDTALATAIVSLADQMKYEVGAGVPQLDGPYCDLLEAALGEVDWREIADGWLEEWNKP